VIAERPRIHAHLLLYVQAFLVQISHTAAVDARFNLRERLARWLVMAHDRVPGAVVPLTHESLALMLGVRRAGVTMALHLLESDKLVRGGRSRITVLDRPGLEEAAGPSYGVPEREYARLFGSQENKPTSAESSAGGATGSRTAALETAEPARPDGSVLGDEPGATLT
jgi:hypothetical protein